MASFRGPASGRCFSACLDLFGDVGHGEACEVMLQRFLCAYKDGLDDLNDVAAAQAACQRLAGVGVK